MTSNQLHQTEHGWASPGETVQDTASANRGKVSFTTEDTTMSKHPTFTASPDAQILYAHIKDEAGKDPDRLITYKELSAAIKRDVQNGARPILYTAMRMAEREDGLVFATVRNEGVRLVKNEELAGVIIEHTAKAGRTARRGLRKGRNVDMGALDDDQRRRFIAASTVAAIQEHAGKAAVRKQLEAKVVNGQSAMPMLDATLAMFRGTE